MTGSVLNHVTMSVKCFRRDDFAVVNALERFDDLEAIAMGIFAALRARIPLAVAHGWIRGCK